jgi:glyoxylase-like metal-dependent hydrolase (beta-lactamase superfamily II)
MQLGDIMARFSTNVSHTLLLCIAAALALAACSPKSEAPPPPAASAAPTQSDNVHAFTIGALQAASLRDGTVEFPNDNKVLGIGHTPEEVAALLSAAGLPTDKIQLGLDPLLVRTTDKVLLFDTGAGGNMGPTAGKLPTSLAEAGVDPQSVTDIFISHVHGDHVGGLISDQGAAVFPNAAIHISAPEWAFLKSQTAATAGNLGIKQYDALMAAMTPKVAPFEPNAQILPGAVKAVEIKGHTPGHSGFMITSGDASLLYMGDAMHHYVISVQKPEWFNGFDADQKTAAASREALLAQASASGQRIYAVHFPFPGLGKFEKHDAGYVWVPE